jgi:hypothetical protein
MSEAGCGFGTPRRRLIHLIESGLIAPPKRHSAVGPTIMVQAPGG